jgi:hypothetical protein
MIWLRPAPSPPPPSSAILTGTHRKTVKERYNHTVACGRESGRGGGVQEGAKSKSIQSARLSLQSSELASSAPSPAGECCPPFGSEEGDTLAVEGELILTKGQTLWYSGYSMRYDPSTNQIIRRRESQVLYELILKYSLPDCINKKIQPERGKEK